jgi:hypothetical protein
MRRLKSDWLYEIGLCIELLQAFEEYAPRIARQHVATVPIQRLRGNFLRKYQRDMLKLRQYQAAMGTRESL